MKPPSMSLREYLIKQTALDMELPVHVVHSIISFQGEDAAKAAHTNNEIEFSGLGKFFVSKKRLREKIENFEGALKKELPEERRAGIIESLLRLKKREDEQVV